MGAYTYSTTAASNTSVDGIGAQGSDSPDNIDNLVRALAASQAALVRDLGGASTSVGGTADAITVSLADPTAATAYFDGMIFAFRVASDSTAVAPTLNVDGIGAKTIKRTIQGVESALIAGDLQAGQTAIVVYRSAWATAAGAFELLNPSVTTGFELGHATDTTIARRSAGDINVEGKWVLTEQLFRGHIFGLTLSNNASDATNDIDIAAGQASSDSSTPSLMQLAASITKRLDASWAVGTNQGGLDTGAIANDTYHVFLIRRSDTGVVDALFSTSPTSPTMPTNYDQKRRIGSIVRTGGAIKAFTQVGDDFKWVTAALDVNASNPGATAQTRTLTVPTDIVVYAQIVAAFTQTDASIQVDTWFSSLTDTDETPTTGLSMMPRAASTGPWVITSGTAPFFIRTNTSGQIRSRHSASNASSTLVIRTLGWVDRRGKDA